MRYDTWKTVNWEVDPHGLRLDSLGASAFQLWLSTKVASKQTHTLVVALPACYAGFMQEMRESWAYFYIIIGGFAGACCMEIADGFYQEVPAVFWSMHGIAIICTILILIKRAIRKDEYRVPAVNTVIDFLYLFITYSLAFIGTNTVLLGLWLGSIACSAIYWRLAVKHNAKVYSMPASSDQ